MNIWTSGIYKSKTLRSSLSKKENFNKCETQELMCYDLMNTNWVVKYQQMDFKGLRF